MSKIICDVCGTSYADTATQCPICGCVRAADAKIVAGDVNEGDSQNLGAYTHVKGGRFSKTNVRKRNNDKGIVPPPAPAPAPTPAPADPSEVDSKKNSDRGLIIAIIILLLAIIAVVAYIGVRYFGPAPSPDKATKPTPGQTQGPTNGITPPPAVTDIPCTKLIVSKVEVTFDGVPNIHLLNVTPEPENTTDTISFSSSDETVATVDQDGKIVSVGEGECVISIICGNVVEQCRVTVEYDQPVTPPGPVVPPVVEKFELKETDITMFAKGERFTLYDGNIPNEEITWTSSDESIATVNAYGTVVAEAKGTVTITGEYKGEKLTCIVRVKIPEEVVTPYKLNYTDVTIAIGESLTLELRDEYGKLMDATFTVTGDKCTIDGNKITGAVVGSTKVTVTYNGFEYTCKVYVRASW